MDIYSIYALCVDNNATHVYDASWCCFNAGVSSLCTPHMERRRSAWRLSTRWWLWMQYSYWILTYSHHTHPCILVCIRILLCTLHSMKMHLSPRCTHVQKYTTRVSLWLAAHQRIICAFRHQITHVYDISQCWQHTVATHHTHLVMVQWRWPTPRQRIIRSI